MAMLAAKQDAMQTAKEVKSVAPRSQLAEALEESEKWIQKAINPANKGNLHKALHVAQGETIPKAKIAKATHSKNPKLRHMAQFAKNVAKEDMADEGNEFTGNLAKAKAQHKDEFEVDGKKYKVVEADPTGLGEEEEMAMDEGYAEMDAWLKSREKEKGTGRFDKKKISTGTVYTRKPETFDDPETDPEATGGAPKRKGRPAGTRRAIGAKHSGRSKLASKDAIAEELPVTDRGEYDQEGESAKHDIKTIVRHAQALHKILGDDDNLPEWVQSKLAKIEGMMIAVDEYMQNQDQEVSEKAPPGAKAERMVKGIKKSLSKDGKLSDKDKAIAYATTWKAKKAGKVEEEGAKPDFLDADKDGNKKETFKKAVADKKDKKVDETTTSGSVATAPAAAKNTKGMQFGKGVYESLDKQFQKLLNEEMTINVNMGPDGQKSISVTATEADADQLAQLLNLAGMQGNDHSSCPTCGQAPCGCAGQVDENSPDWPTDQETIDNDDAHLRKFSGGLNGPKSTGQATVPVLASQLNRQRTMEDTVQLERKLFDLYKNYKTK